MALVPLLNLALGVHPPRFKTADDPRHYGLEYEAVSFVSRDGLRLSGWFIPRSRHREPSGAQDPTAPGATILVGHGYPFDKANILSHTLFLHRRYHLLLMDFRYFGDSEGAYTTAGLRETLDVEAAVAYLTQRKDVDPRKI